MRNHKNFFLLFVLFSVLAAVTAAYGFSTVAGLVPVIAASSDIAPDTAVQPGMLKVTKVPKGALQPDTVRSIEQLRGTASKGFIPSGTVLRLSMFQPLDQAGASAKLSLKKGKVAAALPATLDTTVGGEVKPGSVVTVKAAMRDGSVSTVAERVEVISMPPQSGSVVLALSSQQADKLLSLKSVAGISFVLHGGGAEH